LRFNKSPFLAILCFAAAARAEEINLTPVRSVRELDGIKFQQLEFTEGEKKITYEPPRDWTVAGDGSRIKFTPVKISQAQAGIEQSPLSAPQNFDEATMKLLQQQALASVPSNSQAVSLTSEEKNPLMINQHETYEVIIGYESFGRAYQLSVLYLNLPDTQLRFRCVALRGDFEKIHKAFRDSLFSWQWIEPHNPVTP
jgi:hypothetical protein